MLDASNNVQHTSDGRCCLPGSSTDVTRAELVATATLGARLNGCTCDVEVEVEEVDPLEYVGHCFHDTWCSLLRRRRAHTN